MRCVIACLLTAALTAGAMLVWQNLNQPPSPAMRQGVVPLYDRGVPLTSQQRQQLAEGLAQQPLDEQWTLFISSNNVTDLLLEGDSVWATTFDGGLVRWDARTGAYVKLTPGHGLYHELYAIALGPDGALWIRGSGGLQRLASDGQWQKVWRPWTEVGERRREATGRPAEVISNIVTGPRGTLWFSWNYGVARLEFTDGDVSFWEEFIPRADRGTTPDEAVLTNLTTRTIAVAPDEALWFGGLGGATRFDSRSFSDERWRGYPLREPGLPGSGVTAIAFEPDGAVWFGTDGGLSRLGGDGRWQTFTNEDGLVTTPIEALAVADDGTVWAATRDAGVSRRSPDGQWSTYTVQDGLADNEVRVIKIGDDGSVWFGTRGGISRLEPDGRWRTYVTQDVLLNNRVRRVAVGPDGAIWFGGDAGTSRMLPDGRGEVYTARNGLADGRVTDIAVAPDGAVWVGTDRGVSRFGRDQQVRTYTFRDGLISNEVEEIAFGPDGTVWVASTRGLSWFGPDGQWRTTGDEVNLSLGRSVDIAVGADGTVWVSTETGLGRLQADGRWEAPTAANGLPEGSYGPIEAGPDGRLWLGIEDQLFTSGDQGRWQKEPMPWPGGWIYNIVLTRDGSVWVSGSTTVYQYIGEEWKEVTLPDSYRFVGLYDIAAEANGAVWFGTERGALRYDGLKR